MTRMGAVEQVAPGRVRVQLEPPAPFRLDLTVWALRRRAHNALDRWDGARYRRALRLGGHAVELALRQVAPVEAPRLELTLTGEAATPALARPAVDALTRQLGLNADLSAWFAVAAADPRTAPLAERYRGLKPPRFASLYEALVTAIFCQQITLDLGIAIVNAWVERFGERPAGVAADRAEADAANHAAADAGDHAEADAHDDPAADAADGGRLLPSPATLAALDPDALRPLRISRQKARAVIGLSRAVASGELDLEGLAELPDADLVASLTALHGVGRWTAEYVMLRGLGRLHAFPGDDAGARTSLADLLDRRRPLNHAETLRWVAPWQPYAGMLYFHLLLRGLERAGRLRP